MRKKLLCQRKVFSAFVFSFRQVWQSSICSCKGASRFTEIFCASEKKVFWKHKRSNEFFWKKHSPGWKKLFLACFPGITCEAVENTIFWKRASFAIFYCFVLCSIKNLSEQLTTAHITSWHFLCIIKLHFVRTYEAVGDFCNKTLPSWWFWPVSSRITE